MSSSRDLVRREQDLAPGEARLGLAAQVHDDLEQLAAIFQRLERIANMRWQDLQQQVQVVRDDVGHRGQLQDTCGRLFVHGHAVAFSSLQPGWRSPGAARERGLPTT